MELQGGRKMIVAEEVMKRIQGRQELQQEIIGGQDLCWFGEEAKKPLVVSLPIKLVRCLVSGGIKMKNCRFTEPVNFHGSTLRNVEIHNCTFDQGISLYDVSALNVAMLDVRAKKLVLSKAHITGTLTINGNCLVETMEYYELECANQNIPRALAFKKAGQIFDLQPASVAIS